VSRNEGVSKNGGELMAGVTNSTATGARAGEPDILKIGALAADVMAEAIVRAALTAQASGGLPAARDLAGGRR
jgi:hypothetical protein